MQSNFFNRWFRKSSRGEVPTHDVGRKDVYRYEEALSIGFTFSFTGRNRSTGLPTEVVVKHRGKFVGKFVISQRAKSKDLPWVITRWVENVPYGTFRVQLNLPEAENQVLKRKLG